MKIADIVGIRSLTTVDVSLYFQDSAVSLFRDSSGDLFFSDAFNAPVSLSSLINDSVKEASLGSTFRWTLGTLDVSDYVSKAYVDASLDLKANYTYVFSIDASLNALFLRYNATEASLGNLSAAKFDSCINVLTLRLNTTETSLGYLSPAYVDGSLAARDAHIESSIGNVYTRAQVDASFALLSSISESLIIAYAVAL